MRTFIVAALAVAIVVCLSCGASANGYGYGNKGHGVYRSFRPPMVGVRYYRQPYLINRGYSGYAGQYVSGYNSGGIYGRGGFNIWWLLAILAIFFFILNDK